MSENSKDRIKCGRCQSEYVPRKENSLGTSIDYSCPVCKFGQVAESEWRPDTKKRILHD